MSHIVIKINATSEQAEMLIAHLADAGFEGFEEQPGALLAYIPENDFDENVLASLLADYQLGYSKEVMVPVNWNKEWESNFQPVWVDDFCGIRADFHPPFSPAPAHEIVITPKMSFGTGHHATTASMIRLMQGLDFSGKKVFDFGTGTGILAILAEQLGASQTDAIDYDEWAVNNTRENIAANNGKHIRVWQADTLEKAAGGYDILLANINLNVLLRFMPDMFRLLVPGGFLLLSGILPDDRTQVLESATAAGFVFEKDLVLDNWAAMQFRSEKP